MHVLPHRATRQYERHRNGADADRAHRTLFEPAPEEKHQRRAEGRQQRNHPDMVEKEHLLAIGPSLPGLSHNAHGHKRSKGPKARGEELISYHFNKSTSS